MSPFVKLVDGMELLDVKWSARGKWMAAFVYSKYGQDGAKDNFVRYFRLSDCSDWPVEEKVYWEKLNLINRFIRSPKSNPFC